MQRAADDRIWSRLRRRGMIGRLGVDMTMTITIGWWILPLLVTVASFSWAAWVGSNSSGDYDFSGAYAGIASLIPTLAAWLIWSLLT